MLDVRTRILRRSEMDRFSLERGEKRELLSDGTRLCVFGATSSTVGMMEVRSSTIRREGLAQSSSGPSVFDLRLWTRLYA